MYNKNDTKEVGMEVSNKLNLKNLFNDQKTCKVDWDEETYHNYSLALGSSQIREFISSPNAFKQSVVDREPKKDTHALKYGKAVHAAILEPLKFDATYMIIPSAEKLGFKDFRTNAAKEKIESYIAEAAKKGCTLITEEELNDIKIIARNIERHKTVVDLIKYGEPEVTYLFKDPITGINLKTRIDFLSFNGQMITEVKTTGKSSKRKQFGAEIYSRRYDVQVAVQAMACFQVNGKMPSIINIVAIEKGSKEIAGYYFNEQQIERAFEDLKNALIGIKKCIDENNFPMRQESSEEVYEPKYYIDDIVEKEEQLAYEKFEGAPI